MFASLLFSGDPDGTDDQNLIRSFLVNNIYRGMRAVMPPRPPTTGVSPQPGDVWVLQCGKHLCLCYPTFLHPLDRMFIERDFTFAKDFLLNYLDDSHCKLPQPGN